MATTPSGSGRTTPKSAPKAAEATIVPSTTVNITPELLEQLKDQGLTLDITGQLVELKPEDRSNAVVRVIREGVEDGANIGTTVVKGTGNGLVTVGRTALFLGVDMPAEGVKKTFRGIGRLHSNIANGHAERMEIRAQRNAQRKAEREAAQAAEEAQKQADDAREVALKTAQAAVEGKTA